MPIKECKIGEGTIIHHRSLVNLYGCTIGSDCKVATFVEIQRGVKIGDRVKIEPFVFIPTGVKIEDEVFIGPHVCFINDKYPRSTNPDGSLQEHGDWNPISTIIRRRASIGAGAVILCGIEVGEGAMVGAGSVVTKNVQAMAIVAGNPARVIGSVRNEKKHTIS